MIECNNIGKVYKNGDNETVVLKNISFKIASGEFVAITGPSGSGKSTLMNLLGALDTPTSGSYLLDGAHITNQSEEELARIRRTKIGFVFQSFNLLPRATALRNVMLPLIYSEAPYEKREEIAIAALRSAGMDEERFLNLTNQLSGGQMQRVAIARALVNNPSIVLADEPTGNLDTKTGEIVMSTFKKLNEEGRTIVLITHEPEVANKAKRVLKIRDGEIVSDDYT